MLDRAKDVMHKVKQSIVPRWFRCEYQEIDSHAIKACLAGDATPDQQKRAMQWIVTNAGLYDEVNWEPENERASSFEAGRRYVAIQIIKLAKLTIKDRDNVQE